MRQMSGLANDTLALERNFLKLKEALEMMGSFDLRVVHLLKIEGAIQQVTVLADKYFAGLSSLMDGKVSMDFVSSEVAEKEFSDLKTVAFNSGFELVFKSFPRSTNSLLLTRLRRELLVSLWTSRWFLLQTMGNLLCTSMTLCRSCWMVGL